MMLLKYCTQYGTKFGKLSSGHRTGKRSVFIPIPKKGNAKEIEEKNRMGKTKDLFKKMRDTKGTFHAKTGSIKDRNGMDLTERSRIY